MYETNQPNSLLTETEISKLLIVKPATGENLESVTSISYFSQPTVYHNV
jgi:hypothetical protein